ncbi:MAG: hypothetical protein AB7P37_21080 [Ramlibacter sp.]
MSRSRYVAAPIEQFNLFDSTMPLRNEDAVGGLPESIQELVDVIGLNATIDLVKVSGGDDLKVPEVVDGDSRAWAFLVENIGHEAATKLVERYKGTVLYVAKCDAALRQYRNDHYLSRIRAGEDFNAVRRESGMTRRHLFRLLAATHRRQP